MGMSLIYPTPKEVKDLSAISRERSERARDNGSGLDECPKV